jgi:hypothetical protein
MPFLVQARGVTLLLFARCSFAVMIAYPTVDTTTSTDPETAALMACCDKLTLDVLGLCL